MSHNLLSNNGLTLPLDFGANSYGEVRIKASAHFSAKLDDRLSEFSITSSNKCFSERNRKESFEITFVCAVSKIEQYDQFSIFNSWLNL
jgi:hypothetical protein